MSKSRLSLPLIVALLVVPRIALTEDKPTASPPGQRVFETQVAPLLTGKCLACHAGDKPKGGLDLTRRASALKGGTDGEAIVPGKPDESPLFEKVAGGEMPPKSPLSKEQVAAFRSWIEAGAPYLGEPLAARRAGPDWWSLRPIVRPKVPDVGNSTWPRTPIDAFILARLNEHGLAPSPEADRLTLIRRASFDLTGLPPTPEEIAAFVDDPRFDAYEQMIDRLLASPRYGERWGRHWLDVVRFGESHGYEMNRIRETAWPYRDYVVRAFNRDVPLPMFALEQLAGDTLADADWLTQAATGFLVAGAHDQVGNATVEGQRQQRMDDLDDMITATGSAFLGLTVNCARCHDHKFDPIAQQDYYALQAVFAGVTHAERELVTPDDIARKAEAARLTAELARVDRRLDDIEPLAQPERDSPGRPRVGPRRNVERFAPIEARFVRFTVLATNDGAEPCIDEIEVYSAEDPARDVALATAGGKASASSEYPNAAIHKIAHLNDGLHGNSRSWISKSRGEGWAEVEWPGAVMIDRIVWGRDREEKYKDRLATQYRIEVAREPGKWRVVASSADRVPFRADASADDSAGLTSEFVKQRAELRARQTELRARIEALGPKLKVYAGTFATPPATHLLVRGDAMRPGAEVSPAPPGAVSPRLTISPGAPESERRAALARWLGDPANPLPPRVMVNRAWHYHLGQGIVATPSDFGFNGALPSHPELLDWLASEYVARGFELKPIHRLIMRSAVYRQSSKPSATGLARDGQNRWLWRMSPRRLDAESLRDAILATSGTLDPRMGGPSYNLWVKNTNYVAVYTPKAALGPDEWRRMVYQLRPRSQRDPVFGAFDCPDTALVVPRRTVSTTALQALNLLNSRFTVDQARLFADRLKAEAGPDPDRQAERGFRLAFGRAPSDSERASAANLIRSHGAETFGRAIYNANEFVTMP